MIQVRLIWHSDWPLKNLDKLQKLQCRCSFPGDFHSILQRSAWRRKFNKPIKLPIVFDPVFPSCQLHSVFPDCIIIRISVARPQLFRCLYSELSIRAYSWTQSSFKEPFRFRKKSCTKTTQSPSISLKNFPSFFWPIHVQLSEQISSPQPFMRAKRPSNQKNGPKKITGRSTSFYATNRNKSKVFSEIFIWDFSLAPITCHFIRKFVLVSGRNTYNLQHLV